MKLLLLIPFLTVSNLFVSAQDFTVPNVKFDSTSDYALYNKDIVQCFNWLMSNPCNEDLGKRDSASRFLDNWIEGTPTITVTISQDVITYIDTSPDLVLIFMGGWVTNALSSDDYSNETGSLAGTLAVLRYYSINKDFLRQDDHIDKLLKLQKKGKLEKFVRCGVKS